MNFDRFQATTMVRQTSLPNPASATASSSRFRRRRTIWFIIFSFCACLFLVSRSESFSSFFVPGYFSRSISFSRAKPPPPVSEIYGLQHFVINSEASLSQSILDAPEGKDWKLNPREEVDLRVYSSFDEDGDWEKHVKVLQDKFPVVVFSKSYCPFSKRAKTLLASYKLDPAPKIIEVDLRADAEIVKVILSRLTKHSTFPNVIVRGTSIGGSDNLQGLHDRDELKDLFEKHGVKVKGQMGDWE